MGNGFEDFNDFGPIMDGGATEELAGFLAGFLGVMLIVLLLALAFAIVTYVLQSLALHTIAKRRGIKNSWLAWLPIGCNWILGSISDQYQYVTKGKVSNTRKFLLALGIASMVISALSNGLSNVEAFLLLMGDGGQMDTSGLAGLMGGALTLTALSSLVAIANLVFFYIALYHLYMSCNPNNSVLYLVLSIIFGITQPFLVFSCRNKDWGMPPRADGTAAQPIPAPQPWGSQPEGPAAWQPVEEVQCDHDPGSVEPWEIPGE